MLSNFVLGGPRGKPLLEASAFLARVWKWRRSIAEYGPLVLMLGPLSSQFLSTSHRTTMDASRARPSPSMRSIFKDSGLPKSMALMQWGLMFLSVAFYTTFACDFWVAS